MLAIDALKMRNASAPAFDPTTLFGGTAGGWWDPSDKATMFQTGTRASPGAAVTADGDPVGLILDKSGNNNDLVQATAGARPLFKDVSGIRYLLFDGSNDYMEKSFTLGPSHWTRINGFQVVGTNLGKTLFVGTSADASLFDTSSASLALWGSPGQGPAFSYSSGTNYVATELFANPAPCSVASDNNAYSSTPSISSLTPGGMRVAGSISLSNFCALKWHGGLVIDRTLTTPEIASSRTYFGAKQLRVL